MNLARDALHILESVAPTIASAIGGPFAGVAVNAVLQKLGVNATTPEAQQQAVEAAATSSDPDILLKLKQADNDFQAQMKQLGIAEEKLTYDDLANARSMQMATRDQTVGELAWLVIAGFLLVSVFECVAMVFWPARWAAIPAAALNILGMIFGFLANEAKQASAFYFGSSAGSQSKDATLAEIAKS